MVAIERSNRFPSGIRIKSVDEIVIKGYSITIFLLRWFLNSSRSNFSTISQRRRRKWVYFWFQIVCVHGKDRNITLWKKISKFPFQYFRCSFSFRARHKVVGSSHVQHGEQSIIDRSFRRRTALVSVQHSELLVNDNWNTENESVRRSEPCAVHRRLLDHANSLSAGTRSSIDPTFFTHSLSRASKRQHSTQKRGGSDRRNIYFREKVSNSSLAERRPSESHLCLKYNWRELRICSTSSFILYRISCQLSIWIFVDYFHIENKSSPSVELARV